jgi:hypothetical protein
MNPKHIRLALGLLVLSLCTLTAQTTSRKPGDTLAYEIVVHSQLSGGTSAPSGVCSAVSAN